MHTERSPINYVIGIASNDERYHIQIILVYPMAKTYLSSIYVLACARLANIWIPLKSIGLHFIIDIMRMCTNIP